MINKEQQVFSYNLGLIALMNGIIALNSQQYQHSFFVGTKVRKHHNRKSYQTYNCISKCVQKLPPSSSTVTTADASRTLTIGGTSGK